MSVGGSRKACCAAVALSHDETETHGRNCSVFIKNLTGFVDTAPAHSIIGHYLAVCDYRHSVERKGFTIPFYHSFSLTA
jgi:hypothetical protein